MVNRGTGEDDFWVKREFSSFAGEEKEARLGFLREKFGEGGETLV